MTQLEAWKARSRQAIEENPGRIGPLTLSQTDVLWALRTYQPEPGEPSAPSAIDLAVVTRRDPRTVRLALIAIKRHSLML
jgi:hypothetical protein